MRTNKIAKIVVTVAAALVVAAYLAWQLIGYGLAQFAKGGVC